MKTLRTLILVGLALVIGFETAHWSFAQSTGQSATKEPVTEDYLALHQLESFVTHLQDTKQTNTLKLFNDYSNASIASKSKADLGLTLAILQRLRDGQTNDALVLLEGKLDMDIVDFVAGYRELPVSLQEKMSMKILQHARDYRTKYPFKHQYTNVDEGVANAFKLLDENTPK